MRAHELVRGHELREAATDVEVRREHRVALGVEPLRPADLVSLPWKTDTQ